MKSDRYRLAMNAIVSVLTIPIAVPSTRSRHTAVPAERASATSPTAPSTTKRGAAAGMDVARSIVSNGASPMTVVVSR